MSNVYHDIVQYHNISHTHHKHKTLSASCGISWSKHIQTNNISWCMIQWIQDTAALHVSIARAVWVPTMLADACGTTAGGAIPLRLPVLLFSDLKSKSMTSMYPLVILHSYWTWPFYSEFSHEMCWYSIVMLVYRRINRLKLDSHYLGPWVSMEDQPMPRNRSWTKTSSRGLVVMIRSTSLASTCGK